MKTPECLQMKTGNCGGCPILELVVNSAQRNNLPLEKAATQIANNYCPQNLQPQLRYLTDSHGGHGQFVQQPGIIYDPK